ncbi:hypothetical protein [Streptomyces sp. NPDC091217]|uniref:hypothetical protein n=1 Tax=Streptomyces sp. NPDC091217 TaxID=3365975 RepID=UPI003820B887
MAAHSGRQVSCESDACCGLTWISTAQLDTAKKILSKTVTQLDDGTDTPVVVEPSCAAALKKEASELLGTPDVERMSCTKRSDARHTARDCIRVEHGIAYLKNWRAPARHLGRREHMSDIVQAVAGLLSHRRTAELSPTLQT